MAIKLCEIGTSITLRWVPSHIGIEGNERADQAAKKAAGKTLVAPNDRYSSFSYIARATKAKKAAETEQWLEARIAKAQLKYGRGRAYKLPKKKALDPQPFEVHKGLASRFFQLKIGHAITAGYLYQIKKRDSRACWWCSNNRQDIEHLLFHCRHWRTERRAFYRDLEKLGIPIPSAAEENPKIRLFNDPRAFRALLKFIGTTDIGKGPETREEEEEEANRYDRWDIDLLEEEEEL